MSPSLGSLLQPEEQQWLEVLSRLVERFDSFPAERVVEVLRKVGGHAGQAAAMLRDLSGTEMRAVDPDDAEHVRVLLSSPQMFSHACMEEFRKFDANGDGALEWKEVSSLVMTLYESFGLEPPRLGGLKKFFDANDTNKDGVLNEKEFRRFFEDFLRYAFFDIVSHQKTEEKPGGEALAAAAGGAAEDSAAETQAQPDPKRTTSEGDRERRRAADRRSRDRLGTGGGAGDGEGRHGNHGASSSITFLRCVAADGVPLRRTADYEDRTESVVQAGEKVEVLERWVRTSKGWLPLTNESGKPLFELASTSAEGEKAKSRASRKSARLAEPAGEQSKANGKKESGGEKVGVEKSGGEKVEGEKAVDLTNDSAAPVSTRQAKDSAEPVSSRHPKSSSHHSSKKAGKAGASLPDEWKERFETLQKRFPEVGADSVLQALRNHTGHAGHAAKELRELTAGG